MYALFAYVIWQGWAGIRTRARPLWRMLILPFMFLLLGVWRLALTPNPGWQSIAAWLLAVAAALHLDTHGAGAIVSRALSGSTVG